MAAIRGLQALADRRTVDILVDEVIADPMTGSPPSLRGGDFAREQLPYDPSSIFLLETMVSIACKTKQHIEDTW